MSTQKNEPRALALGVSCYVIWGFFPLYFSLLSPAGAVEVIVHRAVWGLFFCVVALAVTGSLGKIRALIADRGALWRLAVAGARQCVGIRSRDRRLDGRQVDERHVRQ